MSQIIAKGFTLIELVIVIIILSAIGIATTSYIATGVNIYTDIAGRDKSINSLRFVIERMRREVADALPNSAVINNGCLRFTPIEASSLYASNFPIFPLLNDAASIAEITVSDYNFEEGDRVAVYLLSNTDLYDNAGLLQDNEQVKSIDSISTDTVQFSADESYALGSPAKRFFIIRNSVDYCFKNATITRSINQGSEVLMATNITGSFTIEDATLQRNSLVEVKFLLYFDGQEATFEETLHINNVP